MHIYNILQYVIYWDNIIICAVLTHVHRQTHFYCAQTTQHIHAYTAYYSMSFTWTIIILCAVLTHQKTHLNVHEKHNTSMHAIVCHLLGQYVCGFNTSENTLLLCMNITAYQCAYSTLQCVISWDNICAVSTNQKTHFNVQEQHSTSMRIQRTIVAMSFAGTKYVQFQHTQKHTLMCNIALSMVCCYCTVLVCKNNTTQVCNCSTLQYVICWDNFCVKSTSHATHLEKVCNTLGLLKCVDLTQEFTVYGERAERKQHANETQSLLLDGYCFLQYLPLCP